ncbi:MAG: nucleotide exchange factor GrpE [Candidatus Buchananbacteria bacterium]|jgi:molecular chaperone GrpE
MSEEKSMEELQEELIKEREHSAELLAGWQRAKADYSNLKKEESRHAQEIAEWTNAAVMSEVLPVYNHFKLALKHIPEDQKKEAWVQGVIMIQKQFTDFLNKYGISEIKTVGESFDPNLHEALTHEEKEGYEADQIFEEISPGYMLGDKVLMPAMVKVAK